MHLRLHVSVTEMRRYVMARLKRSNIDLSSFLQNRNSFFHPDQPVGLAQGVEVGGSMACNRNHPAVAGAHGQELRALRSFPLHPGAKPGAKETGLPVQPHPSVEKQLHEDLENDEGGNGVSRQAE